MNRHSWESPLCWPHHESVAEMYHIMVMFLELNTLIINKSLSQSLLGLLLRSVQIPNVVVRQGPGTQTAWSHFCSPLLLWPFDNSLNIYSLCVACISSFPIIGDITLGWQLYVETLLFLEPRCTDSQEWHHSIPKLSQTFSETAEQCNMIKVKYIPLFILAWVKVLSVFCLILD